MHRFTPRFPAALLAVSALAFSPRAHAADRDEKVEWHEEWPRFRWAEGGATVGLVTASYLENHYLTGPSSPGWTGAILVDNPVRGLLRGRSDHVQHVATKYADVGYTVLTLFP